jgi:hypothetical protein
VRVKDGVMDPDYDGYCIGGWSGEIIAFETWQQTPMALIAWDASTQRDRITPEGRRRAASQGLSAAQMWLHLSEFERVEGGKGAISAKIRLGFLDNTSLCSNWWLRLLAFIPAIEYGDRLGRQLL